jgi:hypothetical protein
MSIEVFKKNILEKGKCSKKGAIGDVNIKINGLGIGGSLTILFNWLCLFGDKVGNIYVDLSDDWKESTGINKNIFDLILDQRKIEGAPEIQISGHYLHNFNDDILGDIRKVIHDKIKIKQEIINRAEDYLIKNGIDNINKMCAAHIRLTDMAHYHKNDYGLITFDTYVNEIKKIDDNINFFVASDNIESIHKLEKLFPNRIFYLKNINRVKFENEITPPINYTLGKPIQQLGIHRLKEKDDIINDFIDLFTLSKCNKLIGMKYSTYRIAALLFSNTITQGNNIELPLNFSL